MKKKISPIENFTVEDCLKLKLQTRNRLKLINIKEENKIKENEIYKYLTFNLPKKKIYFKEFSERITQPNYKLNNNSENIQRNSLNSENNNNNPKKKQIEIKTALKFVQRQTEWLYKKNQIEDSSNYNNNNNITQDINIEEVNYFIILDFLSSFLFLEFNLIFFNNSYKSLQNQIQ